MTTIQVRIDEKTKKSSQRVLDKIGLDMSSAVKMFLRQVVMRQGIPFSALTENGLTVEQEDAILLASEEAKRGINVSPPLKGKEVVRYLRRAMK